MPFTLSHPAAVIPLRRFGVFSALVIGSMMPDTVYFLPFFSEHDRFGHTLPGIFFYCLPAGMALLWIFHNFAKRPLIALFPQSQQAALQGVSPDFRFGPVSRFVLIVWSILLGTLTHVIWDTFTHTEGYAFNHWEWFRGRVILWNGSKWLVADLVQLGCSLLGAALIAWCYLRWARTVQPQETTGVQLPALGRAALFLLFAVSAIVPLIVRSLSNPDYWLQARRRHLVSSGIIDGIKVVSVELLVFCVLWHMVFRERETAASSVSHSSQA